MKNIALIFSVLFSITTMNAQQSLAGIWNIGKDNTKIEMTESNGIYEAKIVSSDNAKATKGKLILKEVKPADGGWKGKLFSAKKGKWLDAVLKEKGKLLLVIVKAGWMSKTLEWTRE